MKKIVLCVLLGLTNFALSAQDEEIKPKFIKLMVAFQPVQEDPTLKSTLEISGSAVVVKSGAFVSVEHFHGNWSTNLGLGAILSQTVVAVGINVAMTPTAIDPRRKSMLAGPGLFINRTSKDLELELRARYDTKLVHTSHDWQQRLLAANFEICILKSKRIGLGFTADYFRAKSKEPVEFQGPYDLLYETHTQYSDAMYIQSRLKLNIFLNLKVTKHLAIQAGPVVDESNNTIHNGNNVGYYNSWQPWNKTTAMLKVIYDF